MSYARRKLINFAYSAFCVIVLVLLLAFIASIAWTLFSRGLAGLNWHVFTHMTPPPGMKGGLLNAIYGTAIMTLIAIVIATPCGLLAAIYLREYNLGRRLGKFFSFVNDVLLSAPSIIIGLFCYALFVKPFHHFSALAGAAALAIIALPIITRTSEDMLTLVPNSLREAATALGVPYWRVVFKIVLPSIYHGIITGVLLAVARILGETAPLLFTSLNNQFWSASVTKPVASLPVVIYQYAMSPYSSWQDLAWAGALLVTLFVCLLTIITRIMLALRSKA